MFWRFGYNTPSAIDGLLEKDVVSIDEILVDQDVIQEAKSQNTKLIDFLIRRDSITRLIDLFYSIENDKQRIPLIACEILSCEIPELTDAMLVDYKDQLERLWNFLEIPYCREPYYSIQSAYFCKIINIFLNKRTVEMVEFIKSKPENVKKILAHLESSPMMDLLLKLVRMEEITEGRGLVKWLNENGLLADLMNRLDPNLDSLEQSTAQQCISEIIRLSQTSSCEQFSIGVNDFTLQLTSKDNLKTLVKYMLDPVAPNASSSLVNGVTIIIDIIRNNNVDIDNDTMNTEYQQVRPSPISLVHMLDVLTDHIDQFVALLIKPRSLKDKADKPLGFERLKIAELFAELLHCSNMTSSNISEKDELTYGDKLKLKFVETKVLPTCIDLFFSYPWNNFLHYVVYDMLHQIFNGQMNRESNRQLAISIFKEGHLTDKIIEAQEKNDIECAKPKGMRLGYMGHLTFISDEVIKLFEGYPEGIISAVKDSVDLDRWYSYCSHQLKDTKERDSFPLGEVNQVQMNGDMNEDDDEDEVYDDNNIKNVLEEMNRYSHLGTTEEEEDEEEEEGGSQWVNSIRPNEEEDEMSDDEEEPSRGVLGWSDVKFGSNNPFQPTQLSTQLDSSEDEDDPFGDFTSSNEDGQWEDGFTSNFTEMSIAVQPSK
ncbi:SIT4 phosphatase-associated protein-domain-containing protein [Pilobolus umbonatus]|nr:SIT4 phosphatase-associated protein-domain-containing protein [Pilobolus umbonatus]